MKERALSSLCPEIFYQTKRGEGDLTPFFDLDFALYARAELSGKRRGEDGTSLSHRAEATMKVTMDMATLATDKNTRMGTKTLHRVETEWGRQFH